MKKAFLLFSTLFIFTYLLAQSKFEGEIFYEITYEDLIDELKVQENFLPKNMRVEIGEDYIKSIQPSLGGEQIIITNRKTQEMLVLINVLEQKVALQINEKDFNSSSEKKTSKIQYLEERKTILGYDCKMATINVNGSEVVVFYTKDLPRMSISPNFYEINGFQLEIIFKTEFFTSITTATKIEKKPVEIKMEIPKGYQRMSVEEFKEVFGADYL